MQPRPVVLAIVFFSIVWWLLSGGEAGSWIVGIPAVVVATGIWLLAMPATPFVGYEIVRFLPFFMLHSVLGGFDVAWRTFHPRIPLSPGVVEYPLRFSNKISQAILVNTISLLPGTLSIEFGESTIFVHVLDNRKDYSNEFAALEKQVARLTGKSEQIQSSTQDGGRSEVH